ncbi:hypothetical protein [Bacillus sp. COPE52]|uniref:hypothetical protein n=1 Tax=Bacillus sp. COPE52 TaxID=2233998 RepID=UPI000E102F50|nr:hypothetical protein [Bacillus sp. COPE52]AXK19147.1 hypothetical protein DPQ31_16185 [Bacillus sp. COPE52]
MRQEVFVKQFNKNTGKVTHYEFEGHETAEAVFNFIDWCIEIDGMHGEEMEYSIVSCMGVPQECIECRCEHYEDYVLCMSCDLNKSVVTGRS